MINYLQDITNSHEKGGSMHTKLSECWKFVPGYSKENFSWIPSDGYSFHFDQNNCFDLDGLPSGPGKEQADGMVYNQFELSEDTVLAFGMGCDWWAEVRLNGEMIYTTFPAGNISNCFTPENHLFGAAGKKGKNLLAVHVRRGTGSWTFAFAEKDPEESDPCMPVTVEGDPGKLCGPVKPMNAVNNGPVKGRSNQTRSNFKLWKEAKIPFARNHDASFFSPYGGEHTVDVHAIFPDFSAAADDPASYDFTLTDQYLNTTLEAGTQIFYRLGSKIEHNIKKYGTRVPSDFHKWAVICEHIIRHFNEGWADGFHMNIQYWEIWNEPDLDPDDSPDKRTWQGTEKQFFELYRTAATHLKKCFPELKIGGPALSGKFPWMKRFLKAMSEGGRVPLDFFSWHYYGTQPNAAVDAGKLVRKSLDETGYTAAESILNEWNYVRDWGAGFTGTIRTIIGLKGAAFAAAVMCCSQNAPIDMLMYYDARPCVFNGLFDFYTFAPLKTYYVLLAWSKLAALGSQFALDTKNKFGIHAVGASDSKGSAGILISRYFESDDLPGDLDFNVKLKGTDSRNAKVFLLDETHDLTEIPAQVQSGDSLRLTMKSNTVIYIEYKTNK